MQFLFEFPQRLHRDAALEIWPEFFADLGALSPGPECFFGLFFCGGGFEGEPVALEDKTLCGEVVAAEAGDVGAKFAKAGPVGGRVGLGGEEALGGGGILEGCPTGELVGDGAGEFLVTEGVLVLGRTQEGEGVLAGQPVSEAAVAPFGEILLGDGMAIELGIEDGLDARDGVEPIKDGLGWLTVAEASVELFTNVVREAGDFTDASFIFCHGACFSRNGVLVSKSQRTQRTQRTRKFESDTIFLRDGAPES